MWNPVSQRTTGPPYVQPLPISLCSCLVSCPLPGSKAARLPCHGLPWSPLMAETSATLTRTSPATDSARCKKKGGRRTTDLYNRWTYNRGYSIMVQRRAFGATVYLSYSASLPFLALRTPQPLVTDSKGGSLRSLKA